ncbi:MAG TPA: inositol monophosphatase family protein [Gemmatimonadales bacterium]|nr:inositol monophosphatase family protein [Gemmatimonadales bacterium]
MLSSLDLLDLARSAAAGAAGFIRSVERPADPAGWTLKGSRDFVTEVDRTAERLIRDILLGGVPGATIVGEELSPEITTAGLVWVVDPLDGTTNFLHDYPAYAVSIAAAIDGELVAGVVHQVPFDQVYWATRGGGAWTSAAGDGGPSGSARALRVSPIADPAHALIGTGFPFKDLAQLEEYEQQFGRVASATTGIRRAGSAALDLVDVAAGRFEGFWEQRLSAWDIAAGLVLIREAGGVATDFAGRDLGVEHGPVVAGNRPIHAWLLKTLGPD